MVVWLGVKVPQECLKRATKECFGFLFCISKPMIKKKIKNPKREYSSKTETPISQVRILQTRKKGGYQIEVFLIP